MQRVLLYILMVGLGFSFSTFALEAKQELDKLAKAHKQLQSYKVSTIYRLYESHTSSSTIEVYGGWEYRTEKASLSYLSGVTTLYTKDEYLLIDSLEQQILLTYKPESYKNAGQINFDTLQKKFATIEIKEIDKNLRSITFKMLRKGIGYSDMEKVVVYYDLTYRVKKISLYYGFPADVKNQMKQGEKPRIEITYNEYTMPLTALEQQRLLKSHYLSSQKGKLIGVGSCSGYEIIDGRYKK